MIEDKIAAARALIREALAASSRPLVGWSAGKDSMVLLRLVLDERPDVAVWRGLNFVPHEKHLFGDEMERAWGLNVVEIGPTWRDVVAKGDHVELVEVFEVAPKFALYLPIEAEPGHIPGPSSLCAIEKLNAPRGVPVDYDLFFSGHRSEDVDPIYGAIPLASPLVDAGPIRLAYPLHDWTTDEVWEASRLLAIPQNEARYAGRMSVNPDYWPLCTHCLGGQTGPSVICPKIGQPVYNLAPHIDGENRSREWRSRFINLE
jgi:hypothetical protein